MKPTDIRVKDAALWFLPIELRIPLKFGTETLTHLTCARVRLRVENRRGMMAEGWGETPLSVQWVWPSPDSYEGRHEAMKDLCLRLAEAWPRFEGQGHPMEVGSDFQRHVLSGLLAAARAARGPGLSRIPWLAALVACSPFDIALHDAYGRLLDRPIYEAYGPGEMNRDLAAFLDPAEGASVSFAARYPRDFLTPAPERLRAWHLVGGLDLLEDTERTGNEPNDGYPVVLTDWIERDGLKCLKIKLRGDDACRDYERLVRVGALGLERGVEWLSPDFNCTVQDPAYVIEILDRLMREHPRIYGAVLYVEQPFPYDLEENRIDVHALSARKPLFMDESAHDWSLIRLGRELGWTGVALKTCKTQTGALLSLCWARAHGMSLMVQDLTNPRLAQIPHVLLAAHAGTIMGVESNSMQFYPMASLPEARVHPGLYERRNGVLDLSTIRGAGFGYRLDEIDRPIEDPVAHFSDGSGA